MNWITPSWWNEVSQHFLASGSPGLELYIAEGHDNPSETRLNARKFLFANWPEQFLSEENTLDLSQRPRAKSREISISHCPGFVGILISSQHSKVGVGLDIEIASRVRPLVANRVSKPDEFAEAPSAAQLWSAKEAAFKSLREERQPKTISDIRISNWKKISESLWSFSETQFGVTGFVVSERDFVCAAAAAASAASIASVISLNT